MDILEPLVKSTKDQEISILSKFLYDRIENSDSYLVFLGETSSGKSSIINGLLGESVLPVKASPSTATITEIQLASENEQDEYYAINKNATIEKINKKLFIDLCERPDDELKRLKLKKSIPNKNLQNLRIFDTPGYGSIVKEHEEVLKEFLPNSDVIVYTIGYKIGVQEDDYIFMGFLKELVRDDVEIIFLVNRCPIGCNVTDKRIIEIKKYASAILGKEPNLFLVENVQNIAEGTHALPQSPALWNKVGEIISSPVREKQLSSAFEGYIRELYERCDKIITDRYISAKLSKDTLTECLRLQKETAQRIRKAIPELIEPTFEGIIKSIPTKLESVVNASKPQIAEKIKSADKGKKDEYVAYTNTFLVPFTVKNEVANYVQDYIETVLTDLNNRVDDYINKEIINLNTQINLVITTNMEIAAKNLGARVVKEAVNNGLKAYFAGFGGAAGTNAGIANAASHFLKQAGGLFGKTFSRTTHNMLKHFMAKIGANSMRAVGAVVAVVIEVVLIKYDNMTWQGKLIDSVNDGLKKWEKETLLEVDKDLKKLLQDNKATIQQIAKEYENTYSEDDNDDITELEKLMTMSDNIKIQLGYK